MVVYPQAVCSYTDIEFQDFNGNVHGYVNGDVVYTVAHKNYPSPYVLVISTGEVFTGFRSPQEQRDVLEGLVARTY